MKNKKEKFNFCAHIKIRKNDASRRCDSAYERGQKRNFGANKIMRAKYRFKF